MSDNLTLEDYKQIGFAELKKIVPSLDPTIPGSWALALTIAEAAMALVGQNKIRNLRKDLFPTTASKEALEVWLRYEGLSRKPAAGAFGTLYQAGEVGTIIPQNTLYNAGNAKSYRVTKNSVVVVNSGAISLTFSAGTATAITEAIHTLASGAYVTIESSEDPQFDGTYKIIVTDFNTFTFSPAGTPGPGPSAGQYSDRTDIPDKGHAAIEVVAVDVGIETNLEASAQLSLDTAIAGITEPAIVTYTQISGGAAEETDGEALARILLSRSAPSGVFTQKQVELAARLLPGNTRAFVITPDDTPESDPPFPGQCQIYPLRDNDPSIIPGPGILQKTKELVISEGKMPANTSSDDIFVLAALAIATNFVFASIFPDTPTMREAVKAQLKAFFEDRVKFGQSVTFASYLGAIQNTQDLVTSDFIINFELSSPSGDLPITTGEIATLGDVTFS